MVGSTASSIRAWSGDNNGRSARGAGIRSQRIFCGYVVSVPDSVRLNRMLPWCEPKAGCILVNALREKRDSRQRTRATWPSSLLHERDSTQADAEKRVSDVLTAAQQAADTARKMAGAFIVVGVSRSTDWSVLRKSQRDHRWQATRSCCSGVVAAASQSVLPWQLRFSLFTGGLSCVQSYFGCSACRFPLSF